MCWGGVGVKPSTFSFCAQPKNRLFKREKKGYGDEEPVGGPLLAQHADDHQLESNDKGRQLLSLSLVTTALVPLPIITLFG